MFVSIYQLSMSKCPREQMENKSIICTSHYRSIRLTSPANPPLEIYPDFQFPVDSRIFVLQAGTCPFPRNCPWAWGSWFHRSLCAT